MKIAPRNEDLLVCCCPFCASRAVRISNTHTACYTVACDDCGGEIMGKSYEKKWKNERTKIADHLHAIRNVVSRWNQRCYAVGTEKVPALLECCILWGAGGGSSDLGGTFGHLGVSTR
jgi:hypothetical protein